MTKVVKEHKARQEGEIGSCDNSYLDKLAQLRKRGARKYVQAPIIEQLIAYSKNPKKTLLMGEKVRWFDHFSRIRNCSNVLVSKDGKVTSRYCNSRACLVCSAIRTGKLWNKYENSIQALKEPFFVTLTQGPRVSAMKLEKTIATMTVNFKNCMEVLRKRKKNLVGFRKIEVTYSTKEGTYHPHFHVLVDGEEEAYWLVSEWLKRNPKASPKAQDVRKWEKGDLNEVFKYLTKFFDKEGNPIPTDAMYNLVIAMDKKRSFQTFGNFAKGIQEVNDVNKELNPIAMDIQQGYYQWNDDTWYSYKDFKPILENPTTKKMQQHYNRLTQWLNVSTAQRSTHQK
jgi:hypothetical protein